jgi:hypothetical protein
MSNNNNNKSTSNPKTTNDNTASDRTTNDKEGHETAIRRENTRARLLEAAKKYTAKDNTEVSNDGQDAKQATANTESK